MTTSDTSHHGRGFAGVMLALATVIAWYAVKAQEPPPARPADAPPDQFSAGRAMKDVEAIARESHPTGSEAAERVRVALIERFKGLGLRLEVQDFAVGATAGKNLLARLKGTGPPEKKALMLSAHYDSVPFGPGAGDDASGVAAVLETVRAIEAGPPLARDLIVLLTDAEELGMVGATGFVAKHPWFNEVGLVINLDARGNSGPSVMFETSEGNRRLIAEYARAAPHPLAASLSMDLYRLMPNDTDLSVFKSNKLKGLNFAFVGGLSHYHTADDTPTNLSRNTLQHQGENALAMTRHFGARDLDDESSPGNAVYTSVLNRFVIAYPERWAWPIVAVALLLWITAVVLGVSRRRMGLADLTAGVVIWFGAMVASIIVAELTWLGLHAILLRSGVSVVRHDVSILTGLTLAPVLVALAIEGLGARSWSTAGLSLGALAWWLVASLGTTGWMTGSSYLFVFPTIGATLGLIAVFLLRPGSPLGLLATLAGALPLLVVFTPLIRSAFESLSVRLAGPLMGLAVFYVGALLPLIGAFVVPHREDANDGVSDE